MNVLVIIWSLYSLQTSFNCHEFNFTLKWIFP